MYFTVLLSAKIVVILCLLILNCYMALFIYRALSKRREKKKRKRLPNKQIQFIGVFSLSLNFFNC